MSSRLWLLVEWVDESNMFPAYGVVNIETAAYDHNDLQAGNVIYISVERGSPRRAKILRVSENKVFVNEQKQLLEHQDERLKCVMQMCMRTFNEMNKHNAALTYNPPMGRNISLPHVVEARNDDVGSETLELELNRSMDRSRSHGYKKPSPAYHYNRRESYQPKNHKIHRTVCGTPSLPTRDRPLIASTPRPSTCPVHMQVNFDQGTQTDDTINKRNQANINEMEQQLKGLYAKFQLLVAKANKQKETWRAITSESENNETDAHMNSGSDDHEDDVQVVEHVETAPVVQERVVEQPMNSANVKLEAHPQSNALRVRRMSAQTTNNIETGPSNDDLVPIGNGNARVPARLLNDIDWNTHTTATRQLLQAVFPRSVLATHCLTGKQSPAFMNRPPKKILDPKLVEDIVKIVSTRCRVPKNLVRNSITIKCTDEAKLYRNRQLFKQQRKTINQNDENRPPSLLSSDESSATTATN